MSIHAESPKSDTQRPIIGVFDSGFGGLTVLRALLSTITGAHFLYIGDTARLPYGAKSRATVARYAVESARLLESRGAQLLVIACNTATALALDDIRSAVRVPVVGVIEPGALATAEAIAATTLGAPSSTTASSSSKVGIAQSAIDQELGAPFIEGSEMSGVERPSNPEVLVLATAATVQSHAYHAACAALGMNATEKACPLLVPLVEEGWVHHPVTREVIRIYLREAFDTCTPRGVLLGCTHYPLIHAAIEAEVRALNSARRRRRLRPGHRRCRRTRTRHAPPHPQPHLHPLHLRVLRHRLRRKIPTPRQPFPRPTHRLRPTPRPRRLTSPPPVPSS